MINDTQIQCENTFSSSVSIDANYFCESLLLPELKWQDEYLLSTPSPKEDPSSSNHFHKKVNHNAYERDRRKKLNRLYLSLRMLLPEAERSKKMGIPVTVSRVLKYIPELQKQVEKMTKKKQQLLIKEILEGEGLKLINASTTSAPLGERKFYNLHFEIVQGKGMEGEVLCEHLTRVVRERGIISL
ncbi:protein IRON-RELATED TRANSCRIPTION FACTOR 2-like isoform X2 [Carex rostrata]